MARVVDRTETSTGQAVGAERRKTVQLVILLVLGVAAGGLMGVLLWPFLPAIVTSAVLAVLVYPAYHRFERWVGRRSLAAFVGTAVVFFLLLVPALGLSLVLVDQIRGGMNRAVAEAAAFLAPDGTLARWLEFGAAYLGLDQEQLTVALSRQVQQAAGMLADRTLGFLSGVGGWFLQAGAALFTLYYLLRDAEVVVRKVKWLLPLETEVSERLLERAREVTYATVYGNVVVAIVQGLLGGLAFLVLGIPAAALWGAVMMLLSLLPVVGPPLVWGPAAAVLLLNGEIVRGVALLVFGSLVIATVDNLLRAVLMSDRAQLHPLVVFFSVLGGLLLFGAVGLFVGPVVFVMAITLVEMARAAIEAGGPPTASSGDG